MSISSSDLKHALRKTDFPFCAREALTRIEQIYAPNAMGRPPSNKQIDLAAEVMAEFVFCEADRRGSRKRRLSCIQELQLLEVLCDYFTYSGASNEPARNAVFMALFPASNAERCRLLAKLVSMAISTKNTPVLNATGVWMQHLGSATQGSLELAQGLVKDYFVLVPRAGSGLQDLPQLAPYFTSSLLTAVAEIYTGEGPTSAPPQPLLEVVTQWVADLPTLCIAALPAEPLHRTSPTTPYAGLFRWCILAPLHFHPAPAVLLYSRLHLALLESLLECRQLQPGRLEGSVMPQQLMMTARSMIRSNGSAEAMQDAIDRFAQALQLILDSRLLAQSGQLDLFQLLDTLPRNRLMALVLRKHRGQS
ncbi:hypothetical protein R5R35_014194 [Gryllus longicercus]|uniref:Uncharacterized protein n=1 Tax=Gryllus longicercus TaxID=2509291 RepID=A0AAN9VPG8_9ORTH